MNQIMSITETIESIKIQLLTVFPFFGILLLKLPIEESKHIETLATDFRKIYYNEEYVKTLKKSELAWALIHEVMHVAYKHKQRKQARKHDRWNRACDYSIHNVMEEYIESVINHEFEVGRERKVKIHEIITRNPNWLYNKDFKNMPAEEIYRRLKDDPSPKEGTQFDDHSQWDSDNNFAKDSTEEQYVEADWDVFMTSALEKAKEKLAGSLPKELERLLNSLIKPLINWRELLHDFLQFEVNDYSFNPPDKRNQSECILPDFNELENSSVKNIIFWIDTSASITDELLNAFYSEIIGILDYFDYIQGYLGFFDYSAYSPKLFENGADLLKIKPKGGGGTNFHAPFEWINDNFSEEVAAIVIFTDGECSYPPESITNGVPVLWLYSYEQDKKPPFGLWSVVQ